MSANVSGICGIFGRSCQKDDLKKIADGMRAIKHAVSRYMYLDDHIGFYSFSQGDDESRVVYSENEAVHAVVSGEIYNAEKVRSLLESRGHEFSSDVDHEVFAHIFEDANKDPFLIRSIEGAFSFAAWDSVNGRLMLGVDQFGTRPLYYASLDGKILFASESKGLANYSEALKKLNVAAIDLFFSYFYVPTEDTLLYDVKKLLPATYKVFKSEKKTPVLLDAVDYFDLSFFESSIGTDIDALVEKVYESLLSSVAKKVKEKRSVGVSLGGGLDSGLISSLLRKLDKEVVAFVIAAEGGEQNEARLTADYNGSKIDEIFLTDEEYVRNIEKVVRVLDEPIFCWSLVPTYLVIQKAEKQVDTLVTGDGSDMIFWGHPQIPRQWFDPFLTAIPSNLKRILSPWLNSKGIADIMNAPIYREHALSYAYKEASVPASYIYFLDVLSKFDQDDLASSFSGLLGKKSVHSVASLAASVDKCFREVPVDDDLLKRYYTLLRIGWPFSGSSVRPRESICNHYGINLVTPFMDEKVVKLGFSISTHLKQPSRYVTKYVLRRMTLKYKLLPQEIVRLPKRALADVPIASWVERSKYVRDFMFKTLDEGRSLGLVRRSFINRIRKGTVRLDKCFALVMFILWYQDLFQATISNAMLSSQLACASSIPA